MIRLGDWREVLADVERVDAVITDPPYGCRTHESNAGMSAQFGSRWGVRDMDYGHLSPEQVAQFVAFWARRCSGWITAMTSDDLIQPWRTAFDAAGRLDFAPVPIVSPRLRHQGDGPASATVYLMVSRPRGRQWLGWGSLPGWYEAPIERGGKLGGKPLSLMRQIVRHYSRPGDLICDPFAGYGTTLRAAQHENRRAIGAEVDPATHAEAAARLAQPFTPTMLALDGAQSEIAL